MTHPDVAVIGAGMIGAAIADRLAASGCRVAIIEEAFAGAGSTGAAMGHLVVMDDSPAQLKLCHLSRMRWLELLADLPPTGEADPAGTLWLAATEAEFVEASRKVTRFRAEGVKAELLDARALRAAEPSLRDGLLGALRVPGDMVCYPPAIAQALVARAVARGATLHQPRHVTAIEPGKVRFVDGSHVTTGAIVVATGAHSAELVPGLPVMPRRGHLCITERTRVAVHHQLVELGYLDSAHSMGGASVAFNVQPRRTGQLLVGSSRELVGFDNRLNRPLLGRMLRRAVSFIPSLGQVAASRCWIGFRPATADALPLVGRWPAIPDTWIATGHEGLGITMAPGTAELVVAGILGNAPPLDPTPYRPDRPMPHHASAA